MKCMKFCSFAVALLLFAPPALAYVECVLRRSTVEVRAESTAEPLGRLGTAVGTGTAARRYNEFPVRCTPKNDDDVAALVDESRFWLTLTFSADVANDEDNPPLLLGLADDTDTTATEPSELEATDVSGDEVTWEGATFPEGLIGAAVDESANIRVANILIDATGGEQRITADLEMDFETQPSGTDSAINVTSDSVIVADVEQGLEMDFVMANGRPASPVSISGCPPAEMEVMVKLTEGFRGSWNGQDDISIRVSSGTIGDDDDGGGVLHELNSSSSDMVVYDVETSDLDSGIDMQTLTLQVTPGMGEMGDDLTLSAMFRPTRRSPHAETTFVASETVIIGNYEACEGDMLFVPYVTTELEWDTGIVIVNDSEADGSCSLNWGNVKLDDDAREALSTIDVDAKDHAVLLVSDQRGDDYAGSVGVQCTFSGATGLVFLTDNPNGIGQGYVVKPQ